MILDTMPCRTDNVEEGIHDGRTLVGTSEKNRSKSESTYIPMEPNTAGEIITQYRHSRKKQYVKMAC